LPEKKGILGLQPQDALLFGIFPPSQVVGRGDQGGIGSFHLARTLQG